MKATDAKESHMKIGELSKKTGISIKSLHHYDDIDLLKPSMRSEAGHRLYSGNDLLRLQKILALKELGISLNEIKNILGLSTPSIESVFDQNIEILENERESLDRKLRLLKGVRQYLDIKDGAPVEEIVSMIGEFSLHEKYFSKEQLKDLEGREQELGFDRIKDAINEWPKLIEDVTREMNKGTDPKDQKIQVMAKRWMELKNMFYNGDPKLEESARKMYSENPEVMKKYNLDQGVFEYMGKAMEHLKS